MDTVRKRGLVLDGAGGPGRVADVGVAKGWVVAIGEIARSDAPGASMVDLDGLVLAPGFIDSHTHYDAVHHVSARDRSTHPAPPRCSAFPTYGGASRQPR
jgi:N-acyl-D-aspartate/D-glutamate deacylase